MTSRFFPDPPTWFDEFYAEWFSRLFLYVARQFPNVPASVFPDLVQETMVWVAQDPQKRRSAPKIYNYLKSRAIDWLRRYENRRVQTLDGQNQAGVPLATVLRDPDGLSEEQKVVELALNQCLEKLSPRDRALVYLKLDGLSNREIAEALGMTPGRVGGVYSTALSQLTRDMTGLERRVRAYHKPDKSAPGTAAVTIQGGIQ